MSLPDNHPMLDPAVTTLLDSLRRSIRRYVWIEGIASLVAFLGAAFWLTLAADWFFEPSPIVRAVVLACVASVLGVVFVRRIGRRAFVPITDGNAATVLERRFPQFQDVLLTAVVLGERPAETRSAADNAAFEADTHQTDADLHREMLARACQEATVRASGVELVKVFNRRPLQQHIAAAVAMTLSVALFVALFPKPFEIWAKRTLGFSNRLWPRTAHLTIEGFPNRVQKVARGTDLAILVKADTQPPYREPPVAEVRYRTEGGRRGRATMDRRGAARTGENCQEYDYTFRNVLSDIRFDVVGGDDRISDLKIEAVDSPVISQMTLDCAPPAYIRRHPPPLPVTGVMQAPMGSRIVVRAAQANKDLLRVRVNVAADDPAFSTKLPRKTTLNPDRRGYAYTVNRLDRDVTLLFTLIDTDAIASREPVRLVLVAAPDQPPQTAVQLDGIGAAITPQARVAMAGQISDDYGVGRVWFERAVDQRPPERQQIAELPDAPTLFRLNDVGLDVRELGLKPGQKLTVSVQAADLCDLGRGPNQAGSERWLLDVVAPEQLRAMLEARELVLRQRFERMVQEMMETRDLIAHLTFNVEKTGTEEAAEKNRDKKETSSRQPPPSPSASSPSAKKSAEPGDEESIESPERRRMLQALRVQAALSNSLKSAQETLGAADEFDDIRKQLINNRIDNEEWKSRLQNGIAEPLRNLAEKMFPEFDRRLETLQARLDDPDAAPSLRDRAERQAEDILLVMHKVLDRMLEMEDFNQAVELLQNIIKMQEQVKAQTQERHKKKIRDLKE
jgi:hypothetical protein